LKYSKRVFSNLGAHWPRRSTLLFVAFALIVVAFTAFALSWSGLSGFRNSANADPATVPLILTLPRAGSPTPHATHHATPSDIPAASSTRSPKPKPALAPEPKAKPKAKAAHKAKAKAKAKAPKPTPKPKATHTPKPKVLYVRTPKFIHTPKRKAQYPPAAPTVNHYGVLAGAAGHNYTPR
jgi:outer membrane biosynthesis protein TonB